MTTIVSKDTIQKLLKDIKDIYKTPLTDNGIYYAHDDNDMLKGVVQVLFLSLFLYRSHFS